MSQNIYDQDGLKSVHNHDFMNDARFCRAYKRGIAAVGSDYGWHWRVHVGLWAAFSASKLEGDFVECGVNRGFLSSAIMEDLNWDQLGKTFYLLDSFSGIDENQISTNDPERKEYEIQRNRKRLESGIYVQSVEEIIPNFSQWRNICIVHGTVPHTLALVKSERIAYLHLDMNCALPEVAALEYFWEKLVPGAMVLFDDYAYIGYETQKIALDTLAHKLGVYILSIPTGQGLLIK